MSGQNRPQTPQELLKTLMSQLRMELELGTQKGAETPEGQAHLARARKIKSQLINFQQQMRNRQNLQEQQQQQQQQEQQQQQNLPNLPNNAMNMLSRSSSPVNNAMGNTNLNLNNMGLNNASNGMPTPNMNPNNQMGLNTSMPNSNIANNQIPPTGPLNLGNPMNAANMSNANMPNANMPNANLPNANLPNANMPNNLNPQLNNNINVNLMNQGNPNQSMNNQLSAQQQQQIRMAQYAQLNQMRQQQLRSQAGSPQPPGTPNFPDISGTAPPAALNAAAAPVNPPVSGQPTINMNSANGLQQRLAELEKMRRISTELTNRIDQLQTALNSRTDSEEQEKLQKQITYIRNQQTVAKQKEVTLMRELQYIFNQQQKQNANASPNVPPRAVPGQQNAAMMQNSMLRGIPQNPQGQPMNAAQLKAARQAQSRALSTDGVPANAAAPSTTANPNSESDLTAKRKASTEADSLPAGAVVPTPNRYLTHSLPISAQLNVPAAQPLPMKPGRPTLTNGGATDAQALNSPGLVRAPPLDLSGDRALSKKKLSDLVTGIMGEDNEPLIDGDVEDLLLDLADEFVNSVTVFACKLAKHRKSDLLEARDIHMHLERNWNMHIAGFSSDEIRSIRRFVPTSSYQQKLQGIGVAKSMNK